MVMTHMIAALRRRDLQGFRSTIPHIARLGRVWARHGLRALTIAVMLTELAGCAWLTSPPARRFADSPVAPGSLAGWSADRLDSLASAVARQCGLQRPPHPWSGLCPEFERARRTDLKAWLEQRFDAWPMLGQGERVQGLVTGYYEPILTGSRQRESDRQAPLYRPPRDLVRLDGGQRARAVNGRQEPYFTRAQIETGQPLQGQELLWIDDPIEVFFLHVQGSGRVRLRDGSVVRVAFADTNGQVYVPIGRVMRERGLLPTDGVNAPAIKAWLRSNPAEAPEILRSNPRYVFFREQAEGTPDVGPNGSLGVPLTPMRSIAADPKMIPPGALLFLATRHPADRQPLERIVISQDTGAAIVGPIRADLFWGNDAEAELNAGLMQEPGRFWLMWPKGLALP